MINKKLLLVLTSVGVMSVGISPTLYAEGNTKFVPTTFEVDADMLGGGLVVTIPDKLHLGLNELGDFYESVGVVSAKGNINPSKILKISTDREVRYRHNGKDGVLLQSDVEFGENGVAYYTVDELKANLTNVTKMFDVRASVPAEEVSYMGNYDAEVIFNIELNQAPEDYSRYFTYTTYGDTDKLVINGFSEYGYSRLAKMGAGEVFEVELPSSYGGVEVIGVEFDANAETNRIELVDSENMPTQKWILPDNYTVMKGFANYQNGLGKLKGITLNQELVDMVSGVLQGCTIEELIIPSNVITSKNSSVLKGCRIERVIVEEGVTETFNFFVYSDIGEIILPSTLQKVSDGAFNYARIDKLVIPSSVTYIGSFYQSEIGELSILGNTKDNGYDSFYFSSCTINRLYFSKNFIDNRIGKSSSSSGGYGNQIGLLEFEGTVEVLPNNLFNSSTFGTIKFPSALRSIGETTTMDNGKSCYTFNSCIFNDNVRFNDDLKEIGNSTFYGGVFNGSVIFNDGLEKVGSNAFNDSNLSGELQLPNSVNLIGNFAFEDTAIEKVTTFGNTITYSANSEIGYAFMGTNVKSIELPDSIRVVGYPNESSTHWYCGVSNVALTLPQYVEYVSLVPYYTEIIFPDNSKPMAETLTLGDVAYGNSLIKSITLSNNIKTIPRQCFSGAQNLTNVVLGNQVESIEDGGFVAIGVTNIILPESLKRIGATAFASCRNLKEINLENVESIGNNAFATSGITSVTLSNLKSLGSAVFGGCTSLSEVILPNTLTELPSNVFGGCTSLRSITIPNSVTMIGLSAFTGSGLENITIPDSVESLGETSFSACKNLTEVTLGAGVTSIGNKAFGGCTSLATVNNLRDDIELGTDVFKDCIFQVERVIK